MKPLEEVKRMFSAVTRIPDKTIHGSGDGFPTPRNWAPKPKEDTVIREHGVVYYGLCYENYLKIRNMPTRSRREYLEFVTTWKRAIRLWEGHMRRIKRTKGYEAMRRRNEYSPLMLLMYELRVKRKEESKRIVDEDFADAMEIYEEVSKKYHNTLKALGKL